MVRAYTARLCQTLLISAAVLVTASANAQRSERFGPYELHYNVVNSTVIEAEVAAQYGIARGRRRAIVNFSLREHLDTGDAVSRAMNLEGESWDLTGQRVNFDFLEVREGPAIYYIGQFKFLNREWRHFSLEFQPEGSEQSYTFEYKQQMYVNE